MVKHHFILRVFKLLLIFCWKEEPILKLQTRMVKLPCIWQYWMEKFQYTCWFVQNVTWMFVIIFSGGTLWWWPSKNSISKREFKPFKELLISTGPNFSVCFWLYLMAASNGIPLFLTHWSWCQNVQSHSNTTKTWREKFKQLVWDEMTYFEPYGDHKIWGLKARLVH